MFFFTTTTTINKVHLMQPDIKIFALSLHDTEIWKESRVDNVKFKESTPPYKMFAY